MSQFIIEGGRPLKGEIKVSGNKNEALPALAACLLTHEDVILEHLPRIKDVLVMCEILENLGVKVEWLDNNRLLLNASSLKKTRPDPKLCGEVRASILLLGPLLSRWGHVDLPLPGGDIIGARRLDTHFEGLSALGAQLVLGSSIQGVMPQKVPAHFCMDEPSVTATENLLLCSVLVPGVSHIYNAACEPHVAGLCRMLVSMGAKIQGIGTNALTIEGVEQLSGTCHTIGPDFMEVSSFLCLSAMSQGDIKVRGAVWEDMIFISKIFKRLGAEVKKNDQGVLWVDGSQPMIMEKDLNGRWNTIYSGPWPAFPSDVMSVAMLLGTQSQGTMLFHEKMYEGRMFFTDKLMSMGAQMLMCDPHRVVVSGPTPLLGCHLNSPDVRAGMALLMAALIAKGTSVIGHIHQIERGYQGVEQKLQELGAAIRREKG